MREQSADPPATARHERAGYTDNELKKKNIRHGFPQYDLPDLPRRNELRPGEIGSAFHRVNIPQGTARQARINAD